MNTTRVWFAIAVLAWAIIALTALGFAGYLLDTGTAPDLLSGVVVGAFFASVGWGSLVFWLGESIEEGV